MIEVNRCISEDLRWGLLGFSGIRNPPVGIVAVRSSSGVRGLTIKDMFERLSGSRIRIIFDLDQQTLNANIQFAIPAENCFGEN